MLTWSRISIMTCVYWANWTDSNIFWGWIILFTQAVMELSDEQKKRILEEEQQRIAEEQYGAQVRRELQKQTGIATPVPAREAGVGLGRSCTGSGLVLDRSSPLQQRHGFQPNHAHGHPGERSGGLRASGASDKSRSSSPPPRIQHGQRLLWWLLRTSMKTARRPVRR